MTKVETNPSAAQKSSKTIWAVGRRKTAIAQVRMVPAADGGKIKVNDLSIDDFFKGNKRHCLWALRSYKAAKSITGFDFIIKVMGGGLTGQSDAICHGIARVLSKWDEKIRLQMRKEGYLTRDPRAVERKKSGQPKARKRYQYSKR